MLLGHTSGHFVSQCLVYLTKLREFSMVITCSQWYSITPVICPTLTTSGIDHGSSSDVFRVSIVTYLLIESASAVLTTNVSRSTSQILHCSHLATLFLYTCLVDDLMDRDSWMNIAIWHKNAYCWPLAPGTPWLILVPLAPPTDTYKYSPWLPVVDNTDNQLVYVAYTVISESWNFKVKPMLHSRKMPNSKSTLKFLSI